MALGSASGIFPEIGTDRRVLFSILAPASSMESFNLAVASAISIRKSQAEGWKFESQAGEGIPTSSTSKPVYRELQPRVPELGFSPSQDQST